MCRKQHKGRRFRSNNLFLKTNKNISNENMCIAARVNNKKKKHEHKKKTTNTGQSYYFQVRSRISLP